jgi:predicted DNA-binding WGR domain protein
MMNFFVQLEAKDPARNIWRSYGLTGGQDLFGNWVIIINYGRIGAKGRTKTIVLADEVETRRYVKKCLKRRETGPKRIHVGYTVQYRCGTLLDGLDEQPPLLTH